MKHNSKIAWYLGSAIALALATAATPALAAGFQVGEHSATGLGRANAGEGAIADTALVLTKNAAAMTMFDNITVSSQLAFIAPDVNTDYSYRDGRDIVSATEQDYAPDQFVPSFAAIMPVNEKVFVGFAMFSNYGTGTELSDEFTYGDIGGATSIITVDSSFSIAYKVNDLLSIGGGYDLVVGQADMNKDATSLGLGEFDMGGNAIGHGWNVGTLFTINDNNRLALTYRSAVEMGFEGDFTGTDAFAPISGSGKTVTGNVEISLPAIAEISGYHKLTDLFAIHYSAMWTQWSSLDELKASSADCNFLGISPEECFQKDLHYSDSIRYSVGTTAYVSESITLRAGYAYDEQAGEAVVVMPDTNRHQISAGMSYAASKTMSLDFGTAYILGEEITFEEFSTIINKQEFTSTSSAWIVSAQINMIF